MVHININKCIEQRPLAIGQRDLRESHANHKFTVFVEYLLILY